LIEFEFLKSVKSIGKPSRSRIRLMFQFLKNILFETPNEGKPIAHRGCTARTCQNTTTTFTGASIAPVNEFME